MTHPVRRRRRQVGFTMIEVMVAVLLTAIATSGIIGLYMVETRASGFSRHTTEATILAQDQMEILRTSKVLGSNVTQSNLNERGTTGGILGGLGGGFPSGGSTAGSGFGGLLGGASTGGAGGFPGF